MDLSPLIFFALLALSGIFSGSESALFSLDLSQREALKKESGPRARRRAQRIIRYIANPERTLVAILLGNLIVNFTLTEVGHASLLQLGVPEQHVFLVSLVAITLLLLVFGEILPKVFAIRYARSWSLRVANLLRFWFILAQMVAWPVFRLARFLVSLIPGQSKRLSEQELHEAITLADEHGILQQKDILLLKRSVTYLHSSSYDLMLPRSQVFMLHHNTTPNQAKKAFLENGYYFSLIYHEKDGNLLGFIQTRNLLRALFNRNKTINSVLQPVLHLPETMPLNEVVEAFIKNNTEVAAITTEAGELSGVITLKRILSRLLGEDARLPAHPDIKRQGARAFRIAGSIRLNDFTEFFGINLESESSETLSGFILEHLDGFPHGDTILLYENLEFYDMQVNNYMIEKLSLRLNQSDS